ncbi:hypothetical protein GCM10008171_32350 [Methylopila jiangsuensis]|uniref:Integrase n=1 Tax=Methylopila jiangsuensis TaxID=586230 RepID=A0A9W6N582_9HYPH|nr:integrase [Methylopila jiangsuensis]MDR6284630.1 integrase [Methylopila jiangsuensis]GLK77981.1 hypothetical protein GCM10008171_32350 [Methylopila jiangsuensis]
MAGDQKAGMNLKWRSRAGGQRVPYWIAPADAVKEGYPVKSVNLTGLAGDDLAARCERLNAELKMWRTYRDTRSVVFDGTFSSLFDLYERHEQSPFQALNPASRRPYLVYLRKLRAMIGALRVDQQNGLDLARWHKVWREPAEPGAAERLGAAKMALAVLKAAVRFGVMAGLPGCLQFSAVFSATSLPGPRPRDVAPTASDVIAIRAAAHAVLRPSAALAYAIQFETSLRLWDVIGRWVEIGDPQPSSILGYGEKWVGLSWSHISDDLILNYTASKTAKSTGARVHCDLKLCPMVLEEIERIHSEQRVGPLIVCERSGLPWRERNFRTLWKRVAHAAGLPFGAWNRDLRAGAVTEARRGGAAIEDASRMAGHKGTQTTARVYDRDVLEATRRAQASRTKFRASKDT